MTPLVVLLAISTLTYAYIAYRWRVKYFDMKRANGIRAEMIEEVRQGKTPFLLNPGVKIVKED